MKKTRNPKIGSYGSQIMAAAKKIRAANPSKKWVDCVKEAGKALKTGTRAGNAAKSRLRK
jgi:hypothetical protein